MSCSIQLTREVSLPSAIPPALRKTWTLRVTAAGTGIPSEVFVYRALPDPDPLAGGGDTFQCVASVAQLNDLPVEADYNPSNQVSVPYYRSAVFDMVFDTAAEAEKAWADLRTEIAGLTQNWTASQTLAVAETITIGDGSV